MAMEGIKNNVMSQMTRVETPTPAPAANADKITVEAAEREFSPVVETQGSGNQNAGTWKEQDEKDIKDVSPEKVKSAIADINKRIRPTHTQCEFRYHEATKRISITVKDSETNEVIREIPPEKTLDMIAKSLELAGLLVDEKR